MSDWILVPYDDDFETWVRASCVERIAVDKRPDNGPGDRRCRLHLASREFIEFHFKDIKAIANAAGIGYYGGVSLQPKADEPEPVPEFKIGERFFALHLSGVGGTFSPMSFVLTDKKREDDGVHLYGKSKSGSEVRKYAGDCYPTWNSFAAALGVDL